MDDDLRMLRFDFEIADCQGSDSAVQAVPAVPGLVQLQIQGSGYSRFLLHRCSGPWGCKLLENLACRAGNHPFGILLLYL